MKKITLALSTLLSTTLLYGQIVVPEVQKSLYGSVDATWCGNCGNTGIPTTASIYNQVEDKAVFFEMHMSASSNLYSSIANTLATDFGAYSQPQATLNGAYQGTLNGSIESQLLSDINSNYNATSAEVNAGCEWSIENDTLYVRTETKFFTDLSGEFYTGVYITQDSIWEYQANYNPSIPNGDIYHFHILRDVLSENSYGIETGNGSITTGASFEVIHKIKVNPSWNLDHIHINTVVWEKSGADYNFKNANNVGSEAQESLSVKEELADDFIIGLYPNPASNDLNIQLNSDGQVQLHITNQLGAVIESNIINEGNNTIDISGYTPGMYFVSGRNSAGQLFTKQFIKR